MWASKSIEQVLTELNVNPKTGLSDSEASTRLKSYGKNILTAKKKRSVFSIFLDQLKDWLIYILIFAIIVTSFMGEYLDAIIILVVIILNAVLGVIQELKARNAIDSLKVLIAPKALVKRGGNIIEIFSEDLVPGDILILDAGRFIAADVRLIETANLQVEESALTGESIPNSKNEQLVFPENIALGDMKNLAFMSSIVTAGRGIGVVIQTGMQTEVGKIAEILEAEDQNLKTPLEIKLSQLGKSLGKLAMIVCAVIFIIALIQGRNLPEMFLLAVSLAVASIPEGLAVIVTVVLSIGVTKMSKRNAIVRKLPAVETLGSVNIICSDKTGTLTKNKMTVTSYFDLNKLTSVKDQPEKNNRDEIGILLKAIVLCSDASIENGSSIGDPTEIALLEFAKKMGYTAANYQQDHTRISECPFNSDRKLMTVQIKNRNSFEIYSKGAVSNLLEISSYVLLQGKVLPISNAHKNNILKNTDEMSSEALRTLGIAYKLEKTEIEDLGMENDLIFLGVVGMIDPPREEVKTSIIKAKNAGVTPIMITGDHKNTAFAIAKELGITKNLEETISGVEMDLLTDSQFKTAVGKYRVFARVSPKHKVDIVKALKEQGNIVSMTGDGVNDAPSLNSADIGVAMGISGTDVAKDAADIILTDDNFATIVVAIEEGRNIYKNIKSAVMYLLTSNFGEVICLSIALILGWELPLIATQLLWINLLTDSLPAIALGLEPGDPEVMLQKPRDPNKSFFADGAWKHAIFGGIEIALITLAAFWYGYYVNNSAPYSDDSSTETLNFARTMAFMTIIFSQLLYSLAFRNETKSIFKIGFFANLYILGAIFLGFLLQVLLLKIPILMNAFRLHPLSWDHWMIVIGLGSLPLILNEIYKLIYNWRSTANKDKKIPPKFYDGGIK